MQELEKILEEIGELRGQAGSECTSEDHYIKKAWEHCLDRVVGIIRKNMNDGERFEFDFTNVKSFDCQCGRHYVNTGAENNDGWISVDERLPEDDIEVLITYVDVDDEEETWIDITTYGDATLGGNKLDYKEWRNPFPYFKGNYKVTAWKPLPEPYRPERSES